MYSSIALYPDLQVLRQGVYHRYTYPMQTPGETVTLARELTPRLQLGEDHLHARPLELRVQINRHAATIVFHFHRAVLVQGDLDAAGMAGQGFIHGIVDDFLGQVIGSGGVGVHTRALAHGLEAGEDLNILGGIVIAHEVLSSE